MGVVAPQILHEDVGCVGFGREAIVTNVHPGVGHAEAVYVERVESVGVLWQGLSRVRSTRNLPGVTYRGIG